MLDFVQQLVSGIALGCVYGLIALGFVLIYKATEMVNFAQGDIMMLGGFVAYSAIAHWGLNYWVGGLIAIGALVAGEPFGRRIELDAKIPALGLNQEARALLAFGVARWFVAVSAFTRPVSVAAWGAVAMGSHPGKP